MSQLPYSIDRMNRLTDTQFVEKFSRLSLSKRWVGEMLSRRPYESPEQLLEAAAFVWWNVCTRADWVEAFNGRPLIGDQASFAKDLWCAVEDALTIEGSKEIAGELIACNKPYTEKFGYVWILLCEGLTPEQQLWNYRRRIENDIETELRENCVEELKVTMRRLRLCLLGQDPYDQPARGEARVQVESSPIRVGIVGAGVIGETFCDAFTADGAYRIGMVCDIDKARAQQLASRYQAAATDKFEELYQRSDIDLVYIGVPPKQHATMLCAALAAGKHVLCEKPLCLTNEEAARMSSAAQESARRGVVSAINYPMHYVKGVKWFRELMEQGFLGELRRMELKLWFPHWPRRWQSYQKTDWINRREQGGPLREIGSHFYFATLAILGSVADGACDLGAVRRVCAQVQYPDGSAATTTEPSAQAAEIGTLGFMELRSGSYLSLDLLSDVPPIEEEISLTAIGSRGILKLVDFQTLLCSQDGAPLVPYDKTQTVGGRQLMSSAFVVAEMAQAIKQKCHHPKEWNLVSIRAGEQVQRILNALQASQGSWIEV